MVFKFNKKHNKIVNTMREVKDSIAVVKLSKKEYLEDMILKIKLSNKNQSKA